MLFDYECLTLFLPVTKASAAGNDEAVSILFQILCRSMNPFKQVLSGGFFTDNKTAEHKQILTVITVAFFCIVSYKRKVCTCGNGQVACRTADGT